MTGQDRRDRQLADLGVDRAEDRRGAHDDVVGGERDEGSTAHGVVGHVHRDLGRVGGQRGSDLLAARTSPPGVCKTSSMGTALSVISMARMTASESSMSM